MPTEEQWEAYGEAVDVLDQATDDFIDAIDEWAKAALPITEEDNVKEMREIQKQVREDVREYIRQYNFDLELYK